MNDDERLAWANRTMIPEGVRMDTTCSVHKHDEWVPVELHHVWPLGMGGPDKPANKVPLCANGHYATHAFIDLLIRYGVNEYDAPQVPWATAQHFGPKVRALALRGWNGAGRPRVPKLPALVGLDAEV